MKFLVLFRMRALVVAAVGCLFSGWAWAQPVVLITPEEAAQSQAAGGMLMARSTPRADALRIEWIQPDINRPISAPTPIEVRFISNPPAEPRPETFRVVYGAFRIDITQRLLGVAVITKDGIKVDQAMLPSGRHQLGLTLTDTLGREVQHVVSFTVR